jgi:nucleotide-binding universal stress UspA family protein
MTETTQPAAGKPRIVVGVDGSPGSKDAVRWAARMAAMTGARIDVVAAWEYSALFGLNLLPDFEFPAADIEQSLEETVDEVLGADRPADLRVKALQGPAAETLVAVGKDALMIVVGSRGHGGFSGLLLGSVSARVAEHAECPVLVVHGDTPPPAVA